MRRRSTTVPTLESSSFNSYEVGGWTALVQGKVYVDASLYRMDGTNEIISVQVEDGSYENRNAGQTRHTGIEYAMVYTPTRALSFRLGGTNARHEFIRFEDRGVVYDSNEMDRAPNWILNAEVTYRPSFIHGSRIALEWQHLGPYYMDFGNTITYEGYDLLHVRLGYQVRGIEIWANVENVTDALFANVASRSAFGDSYNPGAARNVIFGVGYNFGRR